MNLDRRSVLRGLIFVAAAPAIVRVASLMPVKALPSGMTIEKLIRAREMLRRMNAQAAYDEIRTHIMRQAFVDDMINGRQWTALQVEAMRRTGELRISRILPTELYRA